MKWWKTQVNGRCANKNVPLDEKYKKKITF